MSNLDKIFKAYDIRGLSPEELNGDVAFGIGRAFADFLSSSSSNGTRSTGSGSAKVAVGRDMREDSDEIADGLIAGLVKQDRDVVDLGEITSDMMYFAVGSMGLAGGAMITASHNPGKYDGIKLTGEGVVPVGIDSGLLSIEKEVESGYYKSLREKGSVNKANILNGWVEHAIKVAGVIEKPIKLGLDTGNGMAGIYIPQLCEKTSLQISSIYEQLDGSFPNHVANPLESANTEDLRALVEAEKLDCGLAFDGDGDRAFFCDERSQMLSGSEMGAILAAHTLKTNPGGTILYNAICSRVVPEAIEANGGKAIRTRVGHSFIKEQMRKHKALFACEHSGHFYFADNYSADSGLIAALMLLHILSTSSKQLSELVAPYRGRYFQSGEINVDVENTTKVLDLVKKEFSDGEIDELDGVSVNYPQYWLNVRPSNTEPVVRVNVEAREKDKMESVKDKVLKLIK